MTINPCAKINLGLNVVERRPDGYHNLETVFFPIPIFDTLEVMRRDADSDIETPCRLRLSSDDELGAADDNLVVRAFKLLAAEHHLAPVDVRLVKQIPSQAGMGGGSSDAAFMLRMLNELFQLHLSDDTLCRYAARLGADCPFFVRATPSYATGIGDILKPIDGLAERLKGYHIVVVKPPIAVSTRDAYSEITPKAPEKCCRDVVMQPIETWREELTNDFERPVFKRYPRLAAIKEQLYELGADYALMSGSGSALFGLFNTQNPSSFIHNPSSLILNPSSIPSPFPDCKTYTARLG